MPVAARRAVVPALEKSADEIAAVMQATAPVDDGDLRDSIKVTGPGLSTPPYSQPGGSMVVPELTVAITAGNSEVRHAHLVEHGTAPHANGGALGGTQHPGTAPQPFFWPSFRLVRKRALARIKRAVGKAVREAR